ncbi:MAG: DUF6152 family protein [Steroidobacteraceae bacterium]
MRPIQFSPMAAIALLVLGPAAPAQAHHSAAAYDLMHVTQVQGVLSEFHFENPHVRFVLTARDAQGAPLVWNIEGAPPNWFRHAGIARADFLKGVGNPVTIELHPSRDGSPRGFFQQITFADGTFIRFSDTLQQ